MTTRVDTEDITSTRSEKFLAAALAIFILIGAGWAYVKIDDATGVNRASEYTAVEQKVIDRQSEVAERFDRANETRETAKTELDLAREDLNLAVDRKKPTATLETNYRAAQANYADALEKAKSSSAANDKADAAAKKAEETRAARSNDSVWREWLSAALRLALIAGLAVGGLRMLRGFRERDSRYLPLSFAVAGAGVIMAFVFAVDYITDYIDLLDLGPIVLSVLGSVTTIVAFVALQKYLARRVPRSRVRKGECPFCGFPVRGEAGPHCEGCGRDVIANCAACENPRRVGSPHCPQCGTT